MTNAEALAVREPKSITVREHGLVDYSITVDELVKRVDMIRDARERVMTEDVHFGVIPGTGKKPTLLKAGAESLCALFQLRCVVDPENIQETFTPDGHLEVVVYTHLRDPSGAEIATGFGSCSTRETKYALRYGERQMIVTGVKVPGNYWSDRDPKKLRKALEGKPHNLADEQLRSLAAKKLNEDGEPDKENGRWMIVSFVGSSEKRPATREELADSYNTVRKMAKKRSFIDGTLTATATSEYFTQDVEDMPREQFVAERPSAPEVSKSKSNAVDDRRDPHAEAKEKDGLFDEHVPDVAPNSEAERVVEMHEQLAAEPHGREPKPWDKLKKGSKLYDLAKVTWALSQRGVIDDDLELFAQLASGKPVAKMTHDNIKRLEQVCIELAKTPLDDWAAWINWFAEQPEDAPKVTLAKAVSMFLETINS